MKVYQHCQYCVQFNLQNINSETKSLRYFVTLPACLIKFYILFAHLLLLPQLLDALLSLVSLVGCHFRVAQLFSFEVLALSVQDFVCCLWGLLI